MPVTNRMSRELVRRLDAGRRLDQAVDRVRRAEHAHGLEVGRALDLRDVDARDRERGDDLEVGLAEPGARRVDAHVDRLLAPHREQRRQVRARLVLRRGRDAVLEVDDDRVRARRDRLLDAVGAVGRDVQPGERRDAQTTPSLAQARELVGVDAELGEHRVGVGAVRAARVADLARRLGEAADHVRHLQRPERVVDGGDRAERGELRVGERCRPRRRSARSRPPPARTRRAPRRAGARRSRPRRPRRPRGARRGRRRSRTRARSARSGRPTSRITRSAIEPALAETATQRPSDGAVDVARRVVGRAVAGALLQRRRAGRRR